MAVIFAILAFFGAAINQNQAVGSNAGKVSMQDFHFTQTANKVSTQDISFTQKVNKPSPQL
jgi:hypothetical protein